MEHLFWILVLLTVWAPAFTVMYYANGGEEEKLKASVQALRQSSSLLKRLIAGACFPFVDQVGRWGVSLMGLCGLLAMKLGGF